VRRAAVSAMVSIVVVACGSPIPPVGTETQATGAFVRDPSVVTGITWEWVSTTTPIERTVVAQPVRYTILFGTDGKLQARFDCNRGSGDFRLSDGKVSFGPLISTRMACPEDSLDAAFVRDLRRVTSFFVKGGELFLEMPVDSGTLRFRAAVPGAGP